MRLEPPVAAAPFGLGGIERHVRACQQGLRVHPVVRRDCDADAGADQEMLAVQVEGRVQRGDEPAGQRRRLFGPEQAPLDHRELVAPEPGDGIELPDQCAQPHADRLQQGVANRVAERVVDLLEAVQIQAQKSKRLTLLGACERLVQAETKQAPISQAGQRVMMRQMGDARLDAPPLGHVHHDADGIDRAAAIVIRCAVARFDMA